MLRYLSCLTALVSGNVISAMPAAAAANKISVIEKNNSLPDKASYDWTGIYLGGAVSMGQSKYKYYSIEDGPDDSSRYADKNNMMGRVFAGYNRQLPNNMMLGAELEASFFRSFGDYYSRFEGNDGFHDYNTNSSWSASARLRAGYALNRWLPYIAAGTTFSDIGFTRTELLDADGIHTHYLSARKKKAGYNLAVGLDAAVTDHILAHLEYRYTYYGQAEYLYDKIALDPVRAKPTARDVIIGVAYKF